MLLADLDIRQGDEASMSEELVVTFVPLYWALVALVLHKIMKWVSRRDHSRKVNP
jgi:hypothetical protein